MRSISLYILLARKRRIRSQAPYGALRLHELHIGRVTLPNTFGAMLDRIDFLSFQILTLDGSLGVADTGMFAALATNFVNNEPRLRELRIID